MRPYIAIIVDSFREALYSRVLWVLLGLITLLLLAIMPLGLTHPMTTTVQRNAIVSSQQFAKRLESNGQVENTVGQVVWEAISDSLKERMKPIAAGDSDGRQRFEVMSAVTAKLNDLLQKPDAFTDEQIGQLKLTEEGEELLEVKREDRSEMQQRRLNRLALGSAFRRDLRSGPDRSVLVSYFGRSVGDPLPFGEKQTKQFIKFIVAALMNFIGATIGVFTAILVTASIIPNMFDAGSVNLLFSKPIMRPLLYLSKYIGGCWFVLINAAYLICGIYFVVGWRFDIWNPRVFWAIPILMFLFAVYYSVSAFAGIVWRNTIMCVVAAILFWAACFSVGFVHDLIDSLMMQPRRIIKAVKTGDGVLTISEHGSISDWQDHTKSWTPVLAASAGGAGPPAFARQNNLLGPVYDE
ncbi:MAG: ABC transporter permease, partial [Planctomycetota bacterium]